MRILFVGKGGSGKTTLSSLFAMYLAQESQVLLFDADINQRLLVACGIDPSVVPGMGAAKAEIFRHLTGANPRFTDVAPMVKTSPPGNGSNLVRFNDDDWFFANLTRPKNENGKRNLWVARAGEVPSENVGVNCYHSLNGPVELVIGHLLDRFGEEFTVVDATAGADVFSSSLFGKVDVIVLVVEPTLDSVGVYHQFVKHLADFGEDAPKLLAVGNKVRTSEQQEFIAEQVGAAHIATLPALEYIERLQMGKPVAFESLIDTAAWNVFDRILKALLEEVNRDWSRLERLSHELHVRAASINALRHIDPMFSLAHYAATHGY